DAARLAIDRAERRIERGEQHDADDEQDQEQREQALQLLPQRVGVALLEDTLPQPRERHLEPAPPHLDDVRADGEHRGPAGDPREQRERNRSQDTHRKKPPDRKIFSTSSSNGMEVWVRKNAIAYLVQYASSSLQYFSCSR